MFTTIKNALKTPEIRKKIMYTFLLLVLFRLGCYITIPMVDMVKLQSTMSQYTNSVTGMINMISGGAFSRLSISFIKIPFSAPFPIPTMIAVGVAKPRAHGQAITKTEMAEISP